jgi:hypothetical protein
MVTREEHEQRDFDQVEEAKLAVLDRQIRLPGVWLKSGEGCPHMVKRMDSVACCEMMKYTPCFYETVHELGTGCEIFRDILTEWLKEDECYCAIALTEGGR